MRFVTLDIHQEALVDNERINLLDYAVQDTEGYLYPAFFDLGMARPFFPSLDAAAGGMSEGWITFAVREDAELLVVLAKPDFEAGFEPIATFEQD